MSELEQVAAILERLEGLQLQLDRMEQRWASRSTSTRAAVESNTARIEFLEQGALHWASRLISSNAAIEANAARIELLEQNTRVDVMQSSAEQVELLGERIRIQEEILKTFVLTPWWKRILNVLDGWPHNRLADRRRWRPWHRGP